MAEAPTVKWEGQSGTIYPYHLFEIGTEFKQIPANYIFCKLNPSNLWTAIYIGETGDLSERFDNHHRWDCITEDYGATHICVHESSEDKKKRCAEESDLIANYDPPCNRQ